MALMGGALGAALLAALCLHPPVTEKDLAPFFSTRMTERNGVLLREIPSSLGTYGRYLPLREISPHLVTATVAAEDRRFWQHIGIDPLALVRSVIQNARAGRIVSGASTIPQQIVRIAGRHPRTLFSKLQAMIEAVWLTLSTSKERQLEYYLNLASYGGAGVGIDAAAHRYFRTAPKNLTLAQGAFLAVIPRSPLRLDPVTNAAEVKARQMRLLQRLRDDGEITRAQFDQAEEETIRIETPHQRPFLAPHFTEHVRGRWDLRGVPEVRTTLDLSWQQQVEGSVRRHLRGASRHRISNAAVIVIDNATREVRAWVGSQDYFDREDDGAVDGVLARRQPGSAMKPFLYALALEDGMTAATILPDVRTHYVLEEGEAYIPRNYSREYRGPVRLREALSGSLNVPAVHVAKEVGPARFEALLNRMGFGLAQAPWHYGLGIALGNPEVRLADLAGAYAALAGGGVWRPISALTSFPSPLPARRSFSGGRGEGQGEGWFHLGEGQGEGERVIPEAVAAIVADILSDTDTRDQFFGIQNPFHFDFPAAVKTGTSGNWKDNWSFGFTRDATVGVWVGNFDAEPMQGTSGATGAGPLLRDVLEFVAAQYPRRDGILPTAALAEVAICPLSGMRAGPHCPSRIAEYFVPGTESPAECDWHRRLEVDRRNGLLAGESCPRAVVEERTEVVYPKEFRSWAAEHGRGVQRFSPLCGGTPSVQGIAISSPRQGARFLIDPSRHPEFQTIPLRADVEGDAREVEWIVDGALSQTARTFPFSTRLRLSPGRHTLVARSAGKESEPVVFEVK